MSAPQKAKAPVATTEAFEKTHETSNAKGIANSRGAQIARAAILAALRNGPKTTQDLREHGIFSVAPRVKELRDAFGHNIATDLVSVYDGAGVRHSRVAKYSLVTGAST